MACIGALEKAYGGWKEKQLILTVTSGNKQTGMNSSQQHSIGMWLSNFSDMWKTF